MDVVGNQKVSAPSCSFNVVQGIVSGKSGLRSSKPSNPPTPQVAAMPTMKNKTIYSTCSMPPSEAGKHMKGNKQTTLDPGKNKPT